MYIYISFNKGLIIYIALALLSSTYSAHTCPLPLLTSPAHRVLRATWCQDCIEAVKAHGFTSSPYPVILTFENHTNQENQVRWAGRCRSGGGGGIMCHNVPGGRGRGVKWCVLEVLTLTMCCDVLGRVE